MELQIPVPGLLVLVSMLPPAEAMIYSPQLCYILDGFLGLYGLIITAMFINEKFFKAKGKRDEETYSNPQGPLVTKRNRVMDNNATYTGLTPRREESYKELPVKKERQRRTDQVYQDLSSATRDTYDSLQMQPLPR
ncbi:T-cell surface glycoprotein CD3 zeta chain [Pungitius pungitius]|uniref:T-cell surface glycoprotein CD3 zeta chain n=1 Tax=Pungitius pungitius TaxID=134920 RepID=UPI002E14F728